MSWAKHPFFHYPLLIIDGQQQALYPKHFRDTRGTSLSWLKEIGSGQFSETQLRRIKRRIHAPIIIVDLRQESHGFINGTPISWYAPRNWANMGLSNKGVRTDQAWRLRRLRKLRVVTAYHILKKSHKGYVRQVSAQRLNVKNVMSERELAHKLGMGYVRFFVTDHTKPRERTAAHFTTFARRVPKGTWLYFHCHAGVGRTTTFMVLYNIIKNKYHWPLAKIIWEQYRLGGKDLEKLTSKSRYKEPLARKRLHFLQQYYKAYTNK